MVYPLRKLANELNHFDLIISIFFSIVSLGTALFYFIGRSGFETFYSVIIKTAGLCFFIFLLPAFVNLWNSIYKKKSYSAMPGFTAFITLFALVILILLSYVIPFVGNWLTILIVIIGYSFLAMASVLISIKHKFVYILPVLCLVILFIMWFTGRIYSDGYHDPLFLENMVVGVFKLDSIFHLSVAQMIKTYGIPSTGLNGTPQLMYHWGSHWLFAKLATLLDISILDSYHLVYPALFLPLYFKLSLTFSYDVFLFKNSNPVIATGVGLKFWLTFFILQIGFLPYSFVNKWAVSDSWIESESYSISLAFLFITLSMFLGFYKKISTDSQSKLILYILLIPLLLGFLGLLKASILILTMASFFYVFLKLRLFKITSYSLILCLTLVLIYLLYKSTMSSYSQAEADFHPFHFIKTQVIEDWKGLFFYVHYFWSILYIFLRLNEQNILDFRSLKAAYLENKLIDLELIVIIAVLGFLPGFVFDINGGSAYYFSDVQARISIALLISFVLIAQVQSSTIVNNYIRKFALLLPIPFFLMLNNIFSKFEDGINRNLTNRLNFVRSCNMETTYMQEKTIDVISFISVYPKQILEKIKELQTAPTECLQSNTFYSALTHLHKISTLPDKEKIHKLIYMPQAQTWFLNPGPVEIKAAPFVIPGLTGISLIGGIPGSEIVPKGRYDYGYASYINEQDSILLKSVSNKELCEYLAYKKIRNKDVLILNHSLFITDTIKCLK
ncbi:hypothetical protein Q0590_32175 [Rhodocytophaga aerolata]|uniref:Uncharacterized protein n=1 Tax=Rhodocytophaga aerolata TaxID=455078 RepID=A0ABT8RFT7_9BACT|nr:hypothetical protein [Rhodocytophaga aerolata]MDO1450976.1 hypothetical protein [Rhodocytophaga aerolata]